MIHPEKGNLLGTNDFQFSDLNEIQAASLLDIQNLASNQAPYGADGEFLVDRMSVLFNYTRIAITFVNEDTDESMDWVVRDSLAPNMFEGVGSGQFCQNSVSGHRL